MKQHFTPNSAAVSFLGYSLYRLLAALLFSCFFLPHSTMAEGTRQVAPGSSDITMLIINQPNFGRFASYGAAEASRMYFRLGSNTEKLYIGLSVEYGQDGEALSGLGARYDFQIRRVNPGGDDPLVHGPYTITEETYNAAEDLIPANVSSWSDAAYPLYANTLTGAGGELVYEFSPGLAGDYYIEFQDRNPDDDIHIGYWDFTVTDAAETAIDGRVWSKNWAFRTPPTGIYIDPDCGWDRKFNGELYSYTSDRFVSRIDFSDSGFQGLSFNVAFNSRGPGNSGVVANDRKSVPAMNLTQQAAEHLIFLNPPDINEFPNGECGTLTGAETFQCNGFGEKCLQLSVTRPGQVEIILDFNKNGTFDPGTEDVLLSYSFFGKESLTACVPWDGLKGDGQEPEFGDQADIIYRYTQGVQHWSVYDVEFIKEGFCVEAVRPTDCGTSLTNILYWDDTDIPEPRDPGLSDPDAFKDGRGGCVCRTDDCRTWTFFDSDPDSDQCKNNDDSTEGYGDKSTLNTWWFASLNETVVKDLFLFTCRITGADVICEGETTRFSAVAIGGVPTYSYQWSGPGGFSSSRASTGDISVPGTYCIEITDQNGCTTTCCLELSVDPLPELDCVSTPVSCDGASDGTISVSVDGDAAGYTFSLSGPDTEESNNSGSFSSLGAGTYTVEVRNDATSCTETCEIVVDTPLPLTCTVNLDAGVSCDGTSDGKATVTPLGGNGDYEYLWDNGETGMQATMLDAGEHSVTVKDSKGCETTCTVLVTAPEVDIICPPDLELVCGAEGNEAMIDSWLASVIVENTCEEPVVNNTYQADGFTGLCPQVQEVTFSHTTAAGTTLTCKATISIIDNLKPEIACVGDLILECDGDYEKEIQDWLAASYSALKDNSTDNCDPLLSVSDNYDGVSLPAVSCDGTQGLPVTFTVTDDCMNSDDCTAKIIIRDTQGPTLGGCPSDLELECGDDYAAEIATWLTEAEKSLETNSSDICGAVTASNNYTAGALPEVVCEGDDGLTVTFTVKDGCMNSVECMAKIIIRDTQAPELSCPAELALTGCNPTLPLAADLIADGVVSASDLCGTATVKSMGTANLSEGCQGLQEYYFYAEDECQLTSEVCTLRVAYLINEAPACEVTPIEEPVAYCGSEFVVEDYTGQLAVDDDGCSPVEIVQTPAAGTVISAFPAEGLEITFQVSDECGESVSCFITLPCRPNVPENICTFTPGYWGNHNDDERKDPDVVMILEQFEDKVITLGPWTFDADCIDVILPGPPQSQKGVYLDLACNDINDTKITKDDMNSMLRHAITLILNVAYNPGLESVPLGLLECDISIPAGLDGNSTVQDLLELADSELPGFNSSINEALTAINECYNDCEAIVDSSGGKDKEKEKGKGKGKGKAKANLQQSPGSLSGQAGELRLQPNPAGNYLDLLLKVSAGQDGEIRLWSIQGQLLQSQSWELSKGENNLRLDLSSLRSGTYLLSVQTTEGAFVQRFIKGVDR